MITWPLMSAIQEMCARIGRVTGLGLAGAMRKHRARPILYAIVAAQVLVNSVTIGADLSGMALSGQLIWHLPYPIWLLITTLVTIPVIVFVPYATYVSYLRVVGLTLLTYVATAATIKIDWPTVLRATVTPTLRLDKDFLLALVAVLGTTISSYEFFWQASEEVEELIEDRAIAHEGQRPPKRAIDLRWVVSDTTFGMFVSNLVMYFIILVTALTLGAHGITNVDTAAQAAESLRPFAGEAAFLLFALGILSAGLLAIPVLAGSSAYAVTDALDIPGGLSDSPAQAKTFYAIIVLTSLAGLLVNFLPIPPFRLLFYSAVLSGIIAPVMILIVMSIARDRRVMGKHVNTAISNILGWILFALMAASLVAWLAFSFR